MNSVILIGRLTADPELSYLPTTGTAVCGFTLAVDKELSKEKKDEFEKKDKATADFIRVITYGKQAESCAKYSAKGKLNAVHGRIQTRSYEDNTGTRRYVTEVLASRVEFLEWSSKPKNKDDEFDYFEPCDDEIPF